MVPCYSSQDTNTPAHLQGPMRILSWCTLRPTHSLVLHGRVAGMFLGRPSPLPRLQGLAVPLLLPGGSQGPQCLQTIQSWSR